AERALKGRVRNDGKIVLAQVEAAGRWTLAEYADHGESLGSHADRLSDRIDAAIAEEQLIRRVAQHHRIGPELHLGAVDETARDNRNARAFGEIFRRAEHHLRPRFQIA